MPLLSRAHFDHELADLNRQVLQLGDRAHQAVAAATQALVDLDVDAAAEVVAGDRAINELRYEIEAKCYALLALEQPVAGDMRSIVTALTVAGELERIADHGKKIARICERTAAEPRPVPIGPITDMAEIALKMLCDAVDSFAKRDAVAARAVTPIDDKVDALYKQAFNIMLSYMLESPRAINSGTYLIQVAHELERVGDRATNIAERVIYAVAGELVDLNV